MSAAPNESNDSSRFDPEEWLPQQPFFRVHEFGKRMCCSSAHISNLVQEGEIVVPQELQDSAPSRAAMRIPRASLVDFLRRRSSQEWVERRKREREKRRKKLAAAKRKPRQWKKR